MSRLDVREIAQGRGSKPSCYFSVKGYKLKERPMSALLCLVDLDKSSLFTGSVFRLCMRTSC